MAKNFGVVTRISGKVRQMLYRQPKTGTAVSELPVKPVSPLLATRQMNIHALHLVSNVGIFDCQPYCFQGVYHGLCCVTSNYFEKSLYF